MVLQGGGLEAQTGVQGLQKSPREEVILMMVGLEGFQQREAAVAFLCTDCFDSSSNSFFP